MNSSVVSFRERYISLQQMCISSRGGRCMKQSKGAVLLVAAVEVGRICFFYFLTPYLSSFGILLSFE